MLVRFWKSAVVERLFITDVQYAIYKANIDRREEAKC